MARQVCSERGADNLWVAQSANKHCCVMGTTIYGIIKANVMALDFTAYNLPFNRNRFFHHQEKAGRFNFHLYSCTGLCWSSSIFSIKLLEIWLRRLIQTISQTDINNLGLDQLILF